ncbi:MAG: DUF6364 family protein [Thermodesulfobacteriota bacterium]|nr:DUF6364 family protein [Thermodesulfobacteriota bacterium]
MANITISIEDDLLRAGREYARAHNTSLNAMIRQLLEKSVSKKSGQWVDECMALMDQIHADSKGEKWTREDLYDD